jgi:hypothetical protein
MRLFIVRYLQEHLSLHQPLLLLIASDVATALQPTFICETTKKDKISIVLK